MARKILRFFVRYIHALQVKSSVKLMKYMAPSLSGILIGPQISECMRSKGLVALSGCLRLITLTAFITLHTLQSSRLRLGSCPFRPVVTSSIPLSVLNSRWPNQRCQVSASTSATVHTYSPELALLAVFST